MAIPLKYNVRNLFVRKATTLATMGGIALVVVVVMLLLSLIVGLQRMLVTTSSPHNFIALRKGATSEVVSFVIREQLQALRHLPGIGQSPEGEPLVSPELIVQPLCETLQGGRDLVLVRGVTPFGFQVHEKVRLIAGRAPKPSLGEAAVGIAAGCIWGNRPRSFRMRTPTANTRPKL